MQKWITDFFLIIISISYGGISFVSVFYMPKNDHVTNWDEILVGQVHYTSHISHIP